MRSSRIVVGIFAATLAVGGVASAWTTPTYPPPSGNVTAPINIGSVSQTKNGNLGVNGVLTTNSLGVIGGGNILLTGTGGNYINFDNSTTGQFTVGNGGYGIMADGSGIIYAKNSGGTWVQLVGGGAGGLGGGGQWTTSGNNIYNNNSGQVGINNTSPTYKLDVGGIIRSSNEIISTLGSGAGQIRMIAGNYGALWRNDGANTYFLLTNSGDQYGSWNSLRPLYVNDSSGAVTIGTTLQVAGRIGTNGLSPTSGYPSGWGGGVHAYDVYSEGTVAAGSGGSIAAYMNSSGNMYAAAFLYSSDERLKTDIAPLTGALAMVEKINPVTYQWKDQTRGTGVQIGFIAQNVQSVAPQLVHTDASTTLESVDYARMTPILTGAVHELDQKSIDQQHQIDSLQAQIASQREEIDALKVQISRLEQGK